VSKTPAPKAPPKKTAAGKAANAASASSKGAKAGAKSSAKAAPKTLKTVKAAAPAAKKAVAAPKKAPPVAARAKPAPAPVAAPKPVVAAKPPPIKPAPPPVVAMVGGLAPMTPRKSGRGASKYPAPAVQAPLPPPTSRFADRFAPPRPPTRQMNNLELDTPREKQKFDPKLANAWKSKSGRELSEAEILAMPESEYMNDKQLEFFRVKLQTLKDDLLSNAGETTEHLREDTSIVPDPADRATIEEEHALELRTRDRERKLLKKISQSLQRIDAGDYGFCDETGEPIGLGRLIARPTATLSLEGQQRRELKQKMFGD
jgi:DnaK suppressor protein